MDAVLLRRPSAFLPVAMSLFALAVVIVYIAMFGTARQEDEGTAAHLWQLLMAAQIPMIAFFAIRWVSAEPKQGLIVLMLQIGAALAAAFPIWWFGW